MKKIGKVVLAGAIALGGLGVVELVQPTKEVAASSMPGYNTPGFFETSIMWNGGYNYMYVDSGQTVDISGETTFVFGMDTGYTGAHTVKHYYNGVLQETFPAWKDENHMGEIVYVDVTKLGKHEIVLSPDDDPTRKYNFVLTTK